MCMAFLEYYPKRKLYVDICESYTQVTPLVQSLGAIDVVDNSSGLYVIDENNEQRSFVQWIETIGWTAERIERYQSFVQNHPHGIYCGINNDSSTSAVRIFMRFLVLLFLAIYRRKVGIFWMRIRL